ncbi:MAG: sigma-70 family RNA polymerase sigma factor [Acidobacteria bacterium]|nr:sigma-70 family RNA polymerase sigma factor [Acidobacteriota bacterium]
MDEDPSVDITRLLRAIKNGEDGAADRLYARVYVQLRQMARQRMRAERKDHSFQPTDLIHEAFLKLVHDNERDITGRRHFFALASTVMRRILVDHARMKRAARRSPAQGGQALEVQPHANTIELDQALERLFQIDERQAKVVEMRFFGGFTEEEIADVLGVASRTVKRDWTMARAWLFSELGRSPDQPRA